MKVSPFVELGKERIVRTKEVNRSFFSYYRAVSIKRNALSFCV
ncbi:MAG: hypothetical protein ANABAC_3238 [Anaerolineae bacterium]|nr:MAG: hypothetical protein ANABAC_3238 [Anaerolineae bacterium]